MRDFAPITRRRFAAGGVALLAAACANQPVPEPANPDWRLKLPVWIDGKGPYQFTPDTTAERSVLAGDIAAGLKGARDRVTLRGAVKEVMAPTVRADLGLDGGSHHAAEPAVLARAMLDGDGELGLDILKNYRVTLDFAARRAGLSASDGQKCVADSRHAVIDGKSDHGMVWADATIDGTPCLATLATAAQVALGNRALLTALEKDNGAPLAIVKTIPITGPTSGVLDAPVIHVDRMQMGPVNFDNALIAIADLALFGTPGFPAGPTLLIGMNFLSPFAQVGIDFPAAEFLFALP